MPINNILLESFKLIVSLFSHFRINSQTRIKCYETAENRLKTRYFISDSSECLTRSL